MTSAAAFISCSPQILLSSGPYTNEDIGKVDAHGNIFAGIWRPVAWNPGTGMNENLGCYYVFAAPEDLRHSKHAGQLFHCFGAVVREVGGIKGYRGHDGIELFCDEAVSAALRDKSIIGKWFIPTLDLVHGEDIGGCRDHNQSLINNKDVGAFAGTFQDKHPAVSYVTLTKSRTNTAIAYRANFADGQLHRMWTYQTTHLRCRPVFVLEAGLGALAP